MDPRRGVGSARERAIANQPGVLADHRDIAATSDLPAGRRVRGAERRVEREPDERRRSTTDNKFTDESWVARLSSTRTSARQTGRHDVLDHVIAAVAEASTGRSDLTQHDLPRGGKSNRRDVPTAARRPHTSRRPRRCTLRANELLARLKHDCAGRRRCVRLRVRRSGHAGRAPATDNFVGSRRGWPVATATARR
jgi:hypothetical protein